MSHSPSHPTPDGVTPAAGHSRHARALRIDWLGQMAACLFWIGSVVAYGIAAPGDVLQLLAALSWLVANLAALAHSDSA
ncbi:MAG: hypothetical protein AAFV53_39970 [Myxococcota bacterium]